MRAPHRLFLTTDAVGGVWRYSMAIAAGVAARGWHCTIATMGPAPSDGQYREARAMAGCDLIDTGLPLDWTAECHLALAKAASVLAALAQKHEADSLHLHTPCLAAFEWSVPLVAVAHSCVGTWWHAVHGTPAPEDFRWRMALMAQGLRRADAVIAPSHAMAAALRKEYQPGRDIHVVHNGLAPDAAFSACRGRSVLAAGRLWDRGKNMAVLDAASCLLNAPVAAAGDVSGPDGGLFTPRGIRCLGHLAQADLRARMAQAGVFAAPSVYEPFGLAVLEAAQSAAPLVLADIPTFRELWDGAAIFVPAHDAAAWAEAIRLILDAPDRGEAWGARAQARAARYTAIHMVDASLALHSAAILQAA